MKWDLKKRLSQWQGHCRGNLKDFAGLLYPDWCCGCGKRLGDQEQEICLHCLGDLPRTFFHQSIENPIEKLFWTRADISYATSWLEFRKASCVQQMMHQLKYGGREELGVQLGTLFAQDLLNEPLWEHDVVVPVPLHPNRQRTRGYNQAETLARGMNKITGVPVLENGLTRTSSNKTQTRRSREERFENVESIFSCPDTTLLENRRILLVDDVVTTGATLSSCANELLSIPGVAVLVATIAYSPGF